MTPMRFGCLATLVLGSYASSTTRENAYEREMLEVWAEECCEFFVQQLQVRGVDAINYEAIRWSKEGDAPDLPSVEAIPVSDQRVLVAADWLSLEENWGEDVSIPVTVRIPPMSKDGFIACWRAIYDSLLVSFAGRAGDLFFENSIGMPCLLSLTGARFSLARFVSMAPEAGWLALGDRLHDPMTTTLRQQIGSRILRDLVTIGRDHIGPASIRNALSKTLKFESSAKHSMSDDSWVLQLDYFGSEFFLDLVERGDLERTLEHIAYCAKLDQKDAHRLGSELDPSIEMLIDRLAAAQAWATELQSRLEVVGDFHSSFGRGEKGMSFMFFIDGEPALSISEIGGLVCVPSVDGDPGDQYLRAAGFSISDIDTIFPLVALDLAEIMAIQTEEYDEDLPIASSAFNNVVRSLRDMLLTTGLLTRGFAPSVRLTDP